MVDVKRFILHFSDDRRKGLRISLHDSSGERILTKDGDDKVAIGGHVDWPGVYALIRYLTGHTFHFISKGHHTEVWERDE